jgi:deazaflavin-dependent oxidoreductase (nitroreductase family)
VRINDSIKVVPLVFAACVVFSAGGLELRHVARAEEPQLSDRNAWNKKVIEEFRANGGKVGGRFANATLLLLHTTGAKSGRPRINPLAYLADGDRLVVIASKGGAPTNPDWYYNLVANPEVSVEVGTEQFPALATVATEPERTKLYEQMVAVSPGFAAYQQKAAPRIIPVIILTRKS